MTNRDKIEAYFSGREDEFVKAISRLVAIRSVAGEAEPGAPFGPGPAEALKEALALASEWGLDTENIDGYVGAADVNKKETVLHIPVHLDVVGEGGGWTVTGPFEPRVVDGVLYGRGVNDDKGPLVAALFALRAVKELGLPLMANARILMGTDEESGSSDMAYYYKRRPYAPYAFSPDSDFPVINIEKGHYQPEFSKSWEKSEASPRVSSLQGGFRFNVIPSKAEAVVTGLGLQQLEPFRAKAAAQTGASISLREEAGGTRILCESSGGHAAEPWKANNALTALLELLSVLPLACCGSTQAVRALHALFPHGDNEGKALGIAQRDDLSGPLTVAFTMLTMTETGLAGRFDSRTALCADEQNCRLPAEKSLAGYGFAVTGFAEMTPPHHTPADSEFVKTLLSCYETYTGNKGGCIAIGGGTYVHDIPGGVAFGCTMPGYEANLHAADEHMPVADLITSAKIFTLAVAEICSGK
ncbi:Beta-Ala-Xaa dipeptidase [bioreactor metagenome]|uniref:Beta-Ala-Xaa dipeptidase n=1 Tax=bioreactor metagenome TaxID=1076179 RepID=A0A644XDH7_9ZZZZ